MNPSISFPHISIGEGQPLIFHHGLGANVQQIVDLLGELPQTRLISIDHHGHGKQVFSDPKALGFGPYAQQGRLLLDQLGIEKAMLGGLSMGAGIALKMALEFPEMVNKLILLRPAWLDKGLPEHLKWFVIISEYLREFGAKEGRFQFEQRSDFQYFKIGNPGCAHSILNQFLYNPADSAIQILEHIPKDAPIRSVEALHDLQIPCLILASDQDPIHPFEIALGLAAALPQVRLVKIPSRYVDEDAYKAAVRKEIQAFI